MQIKDYCADKDYCDNCPLFSIMGGLCVHYNQVLKREDNGRTIRPEKCRQEFGHDKRQDL
jgi:hypothetical protein